MAAFGVLGYECNLCEMDEEELAVIRKQIALYKRWRDVLQTGTFYRICEGNQIQWICVSEDRRRAVGFFMQKLTRANASQARFRAKGLIPEQRYHFYNPTTEEDPGVGLSLLGGMGAPGRQMPPAERENYHLRGDALMYAGVRLEQAFCGAGYYEGIRFFGDFASRIYFMESEEA